MKSVLITGGLGFIGSHLAERMRDEYDVTILDNLSNNKVKEVKGCTLIVSDIRTFQTDELFDYVIHLGAIASISDEFNPRLYSVNVSGFDNIFSVNCNNFIYASSAAAINKTNDYGKTKAHNEWMGQNQLGLRFFNVYGERDNGVIGKLMQDNATIYGGEQTRDFIHVSDVVEFIVNNLDKKGILEVGTGIETSIKQVAEWIGKEYKYEPMKSCDELRSVCLNPIPFKVKLQEYLHKTLKINTYE